MSSRKLFAKLLSGSHHIYIHPDIDDIINIQNVEGHAKPYQIRQILKIIDIYNITPEA